MDLEITDIEYKNRIKELHDAILRSRRSDIKKVRKLCREMISLASESEPEDVRSLGFAYYFLAEYYFFTSPGSKNYMKSVTTAITYQQRADDNIMLGRSYNLMGIDASNSGNLELAFDYYRITQRYATDDEDGIIMLAIAMYNQGTIFYKMGELKAAFNMLSSSIRETKKLPKTSDYYDLLMTDCISELGKLSFFMKRQKSAERCMKALRKYLGDREEPDDLIFRVFNVFYCHSLADIDNRNKTIEKILDYIGDEDRMRVDLVEDVLELVDFLVEIRDFEDASRLIRSIDNLVKVSGTAYFKCEYARSKVAYYKAREDEEGLAAAYRDHYHAAEELRLQSGKAYKRFLELQKAMDLMIEDNKRLEIAAHTDELTGISNRMSLNDFSDRAFQEAFDKQETLCIELLDIDDFKYYNDTYGHRVGDVCLQALAGHLKEMAGDRIFVARYGGDEFVVVYVGMTDSDVLSYAEKLRRLVRDTKIPAGGRKTCSFTISQGLYNSVPESKNRLWDFMYLADVALYDIKNAGKDNFRLYEKKK